VLNTQFNFFFTFKHVFRGHLLVFFIFFINTGMYVHYLLSRDLQGSEQILVLIVLKEMLANYPSLIYENNIKLFILCFDKLI